MQTERQSDNAFLRAYGMGERAVSAVLLAGMAVVIVLATFSFLRAVWAALMAPGDPLDYVAFQALFDRVLAAVIAVELAHSIRQMVAGMHGLGQLRTVVVIGMLAVVRKLIAVELETVTGLFLAGIASAVIALGAVLVAIHWVETMRRDPDAE